ncbi:CPBP family intramembrane metalloprotease [candidate division KSB1 bacterium]|nr:CPBP family intramembrane metalloprotease [candidate division KSB1 bacterium]
MTRKPVFWIIFVLLSAIATVFTFHFFPRAFPLVNLTISMNRQQALAEAEDLAKQHDWGPTDFQQAASFSLDAEVQHFVELEAGGVEQFSALLDGKLYSPYKWIVRHFRENEKIETIIRFTPDGHFYGFREQLPENVPGTSLSVDSALTIAEAGAALWGIDLSPYTLVEKSQEKRIGGRTDFSFIYERNDAKLGDAPYRLEFEVSGDKLTGLRHFVKVPEAFQRRYQEMRSANDTIAYVALFIIAVLYVIIGLGIGIFFLLKERWLKWRTALFWGCFIALLQVLVLLNEWPLLWMSYDTALSYNSFFMRQILQLLTVFFAEAALLTLTFMAAEGLTRKAFPNHVQLWKIWRPEAASTKPVLGFTLAGYLGITLFFAFDVALYFLATKVFGWWTPSSSLFEPNVLATYQPWLSSVATSLHAGFWEECLFRAVPIAGAALIGRKFGKEKLWIGAAFLLQAVIFGAGHANYATQPAYARIVELILPSIGFGLIYLVLGLLPGIILHFAYDVVWFALPLFVSSSPNIWVQQALVVIFTLVPLWIVVWARLKKKSFAKQVPADLKNSAFTPPPAKEKPLLEPEGIAPSQVNKSRNVWLMAVGIAGILIWAGFTNYDNLAPSLRMSRTEAENLAQTEMRQRGIELSSAWKTLSRVEAPLNQNDRFIWQEEGDSVYRSLMGSYIGSPYWLVRYATFEGDVADRAEEYSVKVMSKDDLAFSHTLPEKAPGDSLTEQEARGIAEQALSNTFAVDASALKQVSVTPSKLDNRSDWEFVWADTAGHPLASGECRLVIQLAGSEVVRTYQTVHVPEEWSRAERERTNLINILDIAFGAIPVLLLAIAFVFAIVYWSRKQFDVKIFIKIAIVLGAINLFRLFNSWPSVTSMFITAAPWEHQMLLALIFSVLGALFVGASIGMINGFIKSLSARLTGKPAISPLAAIGAGIFIVAVLTAISNLAPSLVPRWANYDGLNASWPIPGLALGFVPRYFMMGTVYLLIAAVADRFTRSWTRNKGLATLFFILLGFALADVSASGTILFWLLSALGMGILLWLSFVLVLRHRVSVAPFLYLPVLLLQGAKGYLDAAFPGARFGYLCGIVVLIVVAFVWERWLRRA